jgi:DNA-binding CsgD family transcriptional regulator
MAVSIDRFIETISDANSVGEVLSAFRRNLGEYGFTEFTYHLVSRGGRRLSAREGVRLATMPDAVDQLFDIGDAIDFDPGIWYIAPRYEPFHWFDGETAAGPKQRRILDLLRAFGFEDGIAAPISSGPGDLALFTLSAPKRRFDLSARDMRTILLLCQATHDRYEELEEKSSIGFPRLTNREHEVMALVCSGSSNGEIADRLKISTHTVDTMIRRIFAKFGVNSRVEAALLYRVIRPRRRRDA